VAFGQSGYGFNNGRFELYYPNDALGYRRNILFGGAFRDNDAMAETITKTLAKLPSLIAKYKHSGDGGITVISDSGKAGQAIERVNLQSYGKSGKMPLNGMAGDSSTVVMGNIRHGQRRQCDCPSPHSGCRRCGEVKVFNDMARVANVFIAGALKFSAYLGRDEMDHSIAEAMQQNVGFVAASVPTFIRGT
jgi:hypothetical protein